MSLRRAVWDVVRAAAASRRVVERSEPQQLARRPRVSRSDYGYAAGEWSNLTADWSLTPLTMYAQVTQQLNNLRGRARREVANNDYARRYVGLLRNGVVGPDGFMLQAQFQNPDGSLDRVANQAFEDHWKKWSLDPEACDVRGRLTFPQMCNQLVGQLPADGEFLLRRWARGPMGLQYQVLEPMLLDVNHKTELPNGNLIRCGIELDPFLRPVAYHLSERTEYYLPSGRRERVPASEIIHGFIDLGVDQLRGLPWLSGPMQRLHMLGGYEEAAVINARYGASKMGIIQRGESEYTGERDKKGNGIEELTPGTIEEIGPNDTWHSWDPSYPTGEFGDFVKAQLRGVASGLMMSATSLSQDLAGVSYNSLRHDRLETSDTFKLLQDWFANALLRPVYTDWLAIQLLRGIPIPRRGGGSRPANVAALEKYKRVRWQGRRWQWVDPLKEVQSVKEQLALGIISPQAVMREAGRDPEEVWRELAEAEAQGWTPPASGTSKPDDESETDGDDGAATTEPEPGAEGDGSNQSD